MTCQVLTLQLVKGVPSPYSLGAPAAGVYDPEPLVMDFLTGVLKLNDADGVAAYDPGIAGLKNGGVNVDSPLLDNIIPIAAPLGVVTDGIRLTSSAPLQSRRQATQELMDMIRCANTFGFDLSQNKPVYLHLQTDEDAGPRYALVYDIQIDDVGNLFSGEPRELVLTVIREAGWRFLPPGANPKLYAFQSREEIPLTDYDYTDLALNDDDSNHFMTVRLANHCRFSGTGITQADRNYVDIPGENIPGDLPALLEVYLAPDTPFTTYINEDLYIARKSRPDMDTGILASMSHNGGDSTLGGVITNVTKAYQTAATGVGIVCDPPGASTQNTYVLRITYATGAIADNQVMASWDRPLNKNIGRVRCFVRARLQSGTVTNLQMQVGLGYLQNGATYVEVDEGPVFDLSSNLAPSTTAIFDAGSFDMSFAKHVAVGLDGLGANNDFVYQLTLKTVARGAVGTSTIVDVVDVILLPFDEYAVRVPVETDGPSEAIVDGVGYIARAGLREFAGFNTASNDTPVQSGGYSGQIPLLSPQVDNRLYFLYGTNQVSSVGRTNELVALINIIPRCRHIRGSL